MAIKRNDTYEYRKVVKRPDLRVSLLEIGFCTENVLFNELKKKFNGRMYLTTDTNKFYFDYNGKRHEMNISGSGESTPDMSGYAKKSDIPTKISQLTNDSDFLTIESVGDFLRNNGYITEEMLADEIANLVTDDEFEELSNRLSNLASTVSDVQDNILELQDKVEDLEQLNKISTVVSSDASNTPKGTSWGEPEVVGTLEPSDSTTGRIYLVPNPVEGDNVFDEYLTVKTNEDEYIWERIGSTSTNVNGYIKTLVLNGREYSVGDNTNKLIIGTDITTRIDGETNSDLNETGMVNVRATTTKDVVLGTNITTLVSSLKTVDLDSATSNNNGLVTALDVKNKLNSLGSDFTGSKSVKDTKGNVTISLKEESGVVTQLGVNVSYAEITKTDGDGLTNDTTIEVKSGDGNKLVIGSDISKIVEFINTRISEELGKLDNIVSSNDFGSDLDEEPVEVTVYQKNGVVDGVDVNVLGADVSVNNGEISVLNENGIVLGKDIIEFKKLIDIKDIDVTNSNGDSDAIKLTKTINNGKTVFDINMVWSENE